MRMPGAVCLIVTLLLAACGGGSSGSTTPSATSSTTGPGVLVYSDISGSIVASDMANGKHWRHRIDPNTEVVLAAECNRNGSRIAYLTQEFGDKTHRQIVIAGENAPEPILISPSAQGITWSPDGRQIAYLEVVPKMGYSLWVVDLESGEQKQVASGPGFV